MTKPCQTRLAALSSTGTSCRILNSCPRWRHLWPCAKTIHPRFSLWSRGCQGKPMKIHLSLRGDAWRTDDEPDEIVEGVYEQNSVASEGDDDDWDDVAISDSQGVTNRDGNRQRHAHTDRDKEALDWETEAEWKELYRIVREGNPPPVSRFNNAMLLCYSAVQAGLGFKGVHRGLDLLALMEACGVSPNIKTYNSFISICAAAGSQGSTTALDYGVRVIELMQEEGITPGVRSCTRLLSALASLDSPGISPQESIERSLYLVSVMREAGMDLDGRLFETLLVACSRLDSGAMEASMRVVGVMGEHGIELDASHYACLLHSCAHSACQVGSDAVAQANSIMEQLDAAGIRADTRIYNALMKVHVRAMSQESEDSIRLLQGAYAVKRRMEAQNVQFDSKTYSMLLNALEKCVQAENLSTLNRSKLQPRMRRWSKGRKRTDIEGEAPAEEEDVSQEVDASHFYNLGLTLIEEMERKELPPSEKPYYNLLHICSNAAVRNDGRDWMKEALDVLERMRIVGLVPGKEAYNELLETCAFMSGRGSPFADMTMACRLIDEMRSQALKPDAVSYTCLINCARKEGTREAIITAFNMFRGLTRNKYERNKHTYTSMIRALSSVGCWQDAVGLLDNAKEEGIRPDRIMYSVCMEAVGHDRDAVKELHRKMIADGIEDDMTTRKQLERVDRYGSSSLRRRETVTMIYPPGTSTAHTGPSTLDSGHVSAVQPKRQNIDAPLKHDSTAGAGVSLPSADDVRGMWISEGVLNGNAYSASVNGKIDSAGVNGKIGGASVNGKIGDGNVNGKMHKATKNVGEYVNTIPEHLRSLRRRGPPAGPQATQHIGDDERRV